MVDIDSINSDFIYELEKSNQDLETNCSMRIYSIEISSVNSNCLTLKFFNSKLFLISEMIDQKKTNVNTNIEFDYIVNFFSGYKKLKFIIKIYPVI